MSGRPVPRRRRLVGATVAALVALGGAAAAAFASPAGADTLPPDPATPATVSADPLPTVQIDGVVWSQAVVRNTVYAGGSFATARPAGAAPGTNTVPRANLLAYDITTGALVSSFAPDLNGQVLAVAASPDGSRVYVGGQFTTADGAPHYRLAAYDTATNSLVASWTPSLDASVRAIVATNATVYVAGSFSSADGTPRTRLAAFSASTGRLLDWAPAADAVVSALVLTPDGSKVIAGGQFTTLSGTSAYGMGALDAGTGAVLPWAATSVVRDAGANSGITSLSTDGTSIYGSGFVFGAGGNVEGGFALDPSTGAVRWVADCHGDHYSGFPIGGVYYTVGHAHFCGNIGGFPETPSRTWHRAIALTTAATGIVRPNRTGSYADFGGKPAPSLLTWFPDLAAGTYTHQTQAAWNVTGTKDYVVLGGEFPKVNNIGQQGLVRFAVRSLAPGKRGPQASGTALVPTLTTPAGSTVRVSFPANWDPDNESLTYTVVKNSNTSSPVYTTTRRSEFWDRPELGFVDTAVTPGVTYTYRLIVSDPQGNKLSGTAASVVPTSGPALSPYAAAVFADGAGPYWRLGEASGTAVADAAGTDTGVAGTGVGRGAPGAVAGDADTASSFDGTATGRVIATAPQTGPDTFSVEAWIRTRTTTGGKIVGFGNASLGTSTTVDRHLYMDNSGRVTFGVNPGSVKAVRSATAYNDGAWHHLVGTLGSSGLRLYVDGVLVASDPTVTYGRSTVGYWRAGGDSLSGWPNPPTSANLAGTLDEVAVYPVALSAAQVAAHHAAATGH